MVVGINHWANLEWVFPLPYGDAEYLAWVRNRCLRNMEVVTILNEH